MICDWIVFDTNHQKVCEKLINGGDKLSLDMAIHIKQNYEYSLQQILTMAHPTAGTNTITWHNSTNKSKEKAHLQPLYQKRHQQFNRQPNTVKIVATDIWIYLDGELAKNAKQEESFLQTCAYHQKKFMTLLIDVMMRCMILGR